MFATEPFFALLILFAVCCAANELQDIVQDITDRYFRLIRCIVYISEFDLNLPVSSASPAITVNNWNATPNLLKSVYEQGCTAFIMQISSYRRRSVIVDLIRGYKQSIYSRYNDKLYLFLPENDDDNDTSFLDTSDMYYMPNLVFVARAGNRYHAIGHNYFHGYKYDELSLKHEILDTWYLGNGFKYNNNLYPDRLANLNGKLVRLSLVNYSPYALVSHENNELVFDGLETRVAAEFVRSSNGTWTGLDNPVDLWGQFFENGTGTGIFGTVLEKKADIGFSAIYQWYCDILDCSYPYIHSDVTCLAPKPEILSPTMTIILPFEASVWIVCAICFLFSGLFAAFVSFVWNKITDTENTRGICLCIFQLYYIVLRLQLAQFPRSISTKAPLVNFYRIFGIYSFLLAIFWQGGISSILTYPRYEKPINDARDLVKRYPQLQWGANHIAWVDGLRESEDQVLEEIVDKFVVADASALKQRAQKKDFAYFMERLQNGHYALNSYIDEEGMKYLRIMEKNMYGGYVVMILTRGSPYQKRLDEIIHRMFDSGLIGKAELQISLEKINNKLQNLVRSSVEKPTKRPTKLRVTHIRGAVHVYAFGKILSLIVFFAEIKYFRSQTSDF